MGLIGIGICPSCQRQLSVEAGAVRVDMEATCECGWTGKVKDSDLRDAFRAKVLGIYVDKIDMPLVSYPRRSRWNAEAKELHRLFGSVNNRFLIMLPIWFGILYLTSVIVPHVLTDKYRDVAMYFVGVFGGGTGSFAITQGMRWMIEAYIPVLCSHCDGELDYDSSPNRKCFVCRSCRSHEQ